MSTHVSATALEETPHETETTQITISDALRRRALLVINDRRTDPQWPRRSPEKRPCVVTWKPAI